MDPEELATYIVVRKQREIATYLNEDGDAVIREISSVPHEEEVIIVIRKGNLPALIDRLNRLEAVNLG